VQVKCFECAALMEADDSEAVVHAFVAHGRERHTWSSPEDAIRSASSTRFARLTDASIQYQPSSSIPPKHGAPLRADDVC
jgi:hypothetical protein